MDTLAEAKRLERYIIEKRRFFHTIPELGWEERETSAALQKELDRIGIPYLVVLGTGIIATIEGNRKKPVIGLRADIDALPVAENADLPFESQHEGRMHACGHDSHMAMLLGAANILWEHRDKLNCTVKLVFQPAEELIQGGAKMSELPELDDVDNYMAIHVWSQIPSGKISVEAGPRMASADSFHIAVKGRGGHGAMPHNTIDPIVAAAAVVGNLQTLVSREISPMEPTVVSVCSFNAGSSFNVIPQEAKLSGTTRTFNMQIRDDLPGLIERVVRNTCNALRADYTFRYVPGTPPTINDAASAERGRRAVRNLVGESALYPFEKMTTGEDFAYFLRKKPGILAFIGAMPGDPDKVYPHHHEKFMLDESALVYGSALFVQYVLETQDEL